MNLSDDDVVGLRDLDEHIQDRLRAAEQMHKAILKHKENRYIAEFQVEMTDAQRGMFMTHSEKLMDDALAAYEATFRQEADT